MLSHNLMNAFPYKHKNNLAMWYRIIPYTCALSNTSIATLVLHNQKQSIPSYLQSNHETSVLPPEIILVDREVLHISSNSSLVITQGEHCILGATVILLQTPLVCVFKKFRSARNTYEMNRIV